MPETVDMALGCSTNTVLHLLAIAYEAGVPIDLKLFNEISAKTPNLSPPGSRRPHPHAGSVRCWRHSRCAGRAGQEGLLDLDVPTVTGQDLGENIKALTS